MRQERPENCPPVLTVSYDLVQAIDKRRAAVAKVEVSNDELRTVRDAMRQLNRLVEDLEKGETEKYVLTKNGRMRAVVVSLDRFASLSCAAG
jgi:hypothetical protein